MPNQYRSIVRSLLCYYVRARDHCCVLCDIIQDFAIHLVYGAPARLGLYLYKYRWWRILRKLTKSSVLFHNIFKDFFLGPLITVELISYCMKLPHGLGTHRTIISLQCYGIHEHKSKLKEQIVNLFNLIN